MRRAPARPRDMFLTMLSRAYSQTSRVRGSRSRGADSYRFFIARTRIRSKSGACADFATVIVLIAFRRFSVTLIVPDVPETARRFG
jgi:Na+-driven multidrug efflux pump